MAMNTFSCGALMLCWAQLCVQDPTVTGGDGFGIKNAPEKTSSAATVSHRIPHDTPCFAHDIFAALRESVGNDGELANSTLALFGLCMPSDNSSSSVLIEVAQETRRTQRNGLKIAYPTGVLVADEDDSGMIKLTIDLPQSPVLMVKPVLLIAFESPVKAGDLEVTFTSQLLQPSVQSACISGETQYILLPGKPSQTNIHQKWTLSVETKSPDMKKSLKDILIGEKSGSNIRVTPLLLFSGETGTDTRYTHVSDSSPASSNAFFLCELKRLLGDLLPQDHPETPPLQLESLQSLPPLTIGLSSSETLLAGLINSTAPTVFSFTHWRATFHGGHHGELSLSPALVEELRQRLQQTVTQIQGIIREEDIGRRTTERLGTLKELSAFPKKKPAAGRTQYRAFLLLKALQTVARAYELQRGLRATRADLSNPARGDICGLRSLSVSLEKHVVGPNTANINNCHGSCRFPLANGNNHAVLLNSHIVSEDTDERAPCCVPVAYDNLEVVDLNDHGTHVSIKTDMIAKECGCR